MKNIKIIVILTHLLIGTLTFAQAPEKMSYQAVVRNTTNNLVTNQAVGMQISILQGSATGTAVYVETQTPTSNVNGLVSLEIGGGTVVSGNMATINWANGPYFIKTETDPTGGSSYTITGTSQLLSTPYALYAKTAGDSWNKTGNSGTVEGTDFIGNSDDKALEFRVSNVRAGLISNNAGTNTSFGSGSLTSTSTGSSNSAFGKNALKVNTTGNSNTAVGSQAMQANTTGNQNVAVGASALQLNTTGINNTGIGLAALQRNNIGANNTAVGRTSMVNTTSGSDNTALGTDALGVNTTGSENTAIGKGANVSVNNLSNATAIGSGAIVDASNKIRLGNNNVTATDIAGQLKVNAQSTTNNFTLPATRGTANQVLSTDGSGATSWVTPSGGGGGTNIYTNDGTLLGNRSVTLGGFNLDFAGTGNLGLNDNALRFRAANDNNHGLQFNSTVDGPSIFGFGGGTLRFGSAGGSEALRWSSTGVQINGGSNSYTLPTTKGTANQVLSTDGAGATSWVTPSAGGSGAQVALIATKTTNAQVLSLANGTNTGDLITFDNVVTSNASLGTYNTSTNTFTVSQTGVYIIQAVTRTPDAPTSSQTTNQFLFVDVDNAGITGINNIITDYQGSAPNNFPSGVKGRGYTAVTLYLTAGQTINIKGLTANSSTISQPLNTNGTCKFMIFKL